MNIVDVVHQSKLDLVFKPIYSGIGHVLMFHRVNDKNDHIITNGPIVSPRYLEMVIKYFIKKNIDIISLDELYNRIRCNKRIKRFVTFTFDDGYVDNMTHAFPIFAEYNVPFTIFLTTGYPDHTVVLWWYLLEDLVLNNTKIKFSDGIASFTFDAFTPDDKFMAYRKIRQYFIQSNRKSLPHKLESVFHAYGYDLFETTKKMALSWNQVIELSKHPLVTIGAHTMNHLALNQLNETEVKEEVEESAHIIAEKIGKPVLYFAYPFGSPNEVGQREISIASNCNIKMAFTTRSGNIFRQHVNHLFSMPRIDTRENFNITKLDLYIHGMTPCIKNRLRRVITV